MIHLSNLTCGSFFGGQVTEMKAHIESIDKTVGCYKIGVNNGEDTGQTIFQCHMHLIPMRKGDVEDPRGGIRHIIPEKGYYGALPPGERLEELVITPLFMLTCKIIPYKETSIVASVFQRPVSDGSPVLPRTRTAISL
jgi:hypothetical protein